MAAPRARDMFSTNDPVQIVEKFDDYKDTLAKALDEPMPWGYGGPAMGGGQQSAADLVAQGLASPEITKSLNPETVESIRTQLAQADLVKDGVSQGISLTGPISTGLVAFDLDAPSKKLYPRETPLRNRIPRKKGIGTSHRFKVISGISGSQTGVPDQYPGISDSVSTAFGPSNYARGPRISYNGYDVAVGYSQFSLSDSVPWSAQFSGEGFEDIRQLSQTSVLYASMLEEEKLIISGRGTGSGFSGALAAPGTPTLAQRAPAAGEAAITGAGTNVYAIVTADAGPFGQSVLSTVSTGVAPASGVVDVTVPTLPAGAVGYRVYVGTGSAAPLTSAMWFAGRSANGGVFTIQGALPTSGVAASTVTTDTSAYAAGYDGILAICLGPNSGYVKNISTIPNQPTSGINGGLNIANPGSEFYKAFDVMYQNNGADPDEVLCNGSDRRQLSDLLKTSSSSSYRITVDNAGEAHNAQLGALVTGLQNEVTGKMVDLSVNRFIPQGVMPIISWTLPLPDSNVSDVWEMRLVQDYMGIQWPVSQFAYECSSYWYGSLICPAPSWNGAISGIRLV
jgi:hypothetical protein